MKRYSLYIISIFLICFSSGCVDDSLIDDTEYKGKANIRVFTTTPEAEIAKLETKAAHENDLPTEAAVNSLMVLVFEDATPEAKLLQIENVTMTNDYDGTVSLSGRNNVHIRLVANYNLPANLKGKTWSEIRTSHIYNVDNSTSQTFPMTADIPNFDIKPNNHIGKDDRVKLVRAMAKLTLNISGDGNFNYIGNKIQQIEKQGYLFAQGLNDYTGPTSTTSRYNETEYNKKTITYSPERKNTGKDQKTPLDTRTYVLIEGTYNGVKSFYRVDFGSRNSNEEMEYKDFKRNTNYLLNVNIVNYGFATEEEAIAAPANSDIIEVSIVESSSYELLVDESGHYLGVSNSIVLIYGKSQYMSDGFEGEPQDHSYVFTTITNEKISEWNENDIEIISTDGINKDDLKIVVVDKYDEDGNPISGMKEYLLIGKITSIVYEFDQDRYPFQEAPGYASVSIRYGRLVKDITILRYYYLDSPFGYITTGDGGTASVATIKKHRMADGSYFEKPINWLLLTSEGGNCRSTDYGNSENHIIHGSNLSDAISVAFREHLDGTTMGVKSANTKYEGFRFADAYISQAGDAIRYKLILAQANSDLSGYFGRDSYVPKYKDKYEVEIDGGVEYDSYLVSHRIYRKYNGCSDLNPLDQDLWHTPSNRQLIGLWLTDNSNSWKVNSISDPVNPPIDNHLFFDARAGGYTQAHHDYYFKTGSWGNGDANPDVEVSSVFEYYFLLKDERKWYMDFMNGESKRINYRNGYIRCVRRLPLENMPADIRSKLPSTTADLNKAPVSGKQVTMDPAGYLSEDYFNNVDNPIARKIEVQPKVSETDQTTIYTANGTGWKRTTKNIEKEYTLAEAYTKATVGENRLPTQRELLLIYVYHDLLVNAGMEPFYKDEADGYYDGTGTSTKPNKLLYKMYRYPAANHDAYLHWYWTSTTDKGQFTGNDNGSVIPHRVSFHFGDVNRRGGNEITSKDHYRAVKTIQEK